MLELLHQSISPVNIIFTTLFGLCMLYWFTVIIGALDFGTLDLDFDIDADVDAEVDADVDGSTGMSLVGILHFFNFGKLPFMIIMTVLTLCMWVISLLNNYYIGHGSFSIALLLLVPTIFMGLVITKILTTPLIPLFKGMGEGNEEVRYIGKACKVILPPTTTVVGQGEVNFEGNVLLINIKLIEDGETLKKGDKATVLDEIKGKKVYLVDKI